MIIGDRLRTLREAKKMAAVADFRSVGAVAPGSRYLTQVILRPLPLERVRVVVEVGSGTGVMAGVAQPDSL